MSGTLGGPPAASHEGRRHTDRDNLALAAVAEVKAGRPAEGLALADRALADEPNHVTALGAAAQALAMMGRHEEGARRLVRLLRVAPGNAWAEGRLAAAAKRFPDDAEVAETLARSRAFRESAADRLPRWSPTHPLARTPDPDTRRAYLDLLVRAVTGFLLEDGAIDPGHADGRFDREARAEGRDWPRLGHTMIGLARLQQLREACEDVIARGIPGDFLEAGVWRGGACILMRAVIAAHGDAERRVWLADSFAGVPGEHAYAEEDHYGRWPFHEYAALAVSRAEVEANFARYGLLDERVMFIEGLFADTLPCAPVERLSVLRLDGDLYASTMDALRALYPRVSPGGYVIVDDYGIVNGARFATLDYRKAHGVTAPMWNIDGQGVFWRKE